MNVKLVVDLQSSTAENKNEDKLDKNEKGDTTM